MRFLILLCIGCAAPAPRSRELPPTPTPPPVAVVAIPDAAPVVVAVPDASPFHPDRDPYAPMGLEVIPTTAHRSASGLSFQVLSGVGGGLAPADNDRVVASWTSWNADGVRNEQIPDRKQRLREFPPALREGIALMTVGQRARLWVPPADAADAADAASELLIYDVDLTTVMPAPPTPIDVAAPPKNARKTKSGVRYLVLAKGKGKRPKEHDRVQVHYSGWTTDGALFDSSIERGQPAKFKVNGVIKGWTDAFKKMRPGATWRLWIPAELAYDNKPGKPMGMLVFDVELLSVEVMPAPPTTPRDVKRAPRRAKRTKGGVRYRYLKRGPRRGAKAKDTDTVTVHYSGWTTDGKMFDSSITRTGGAPATFKLTRVIKGWQEGVSQMRPGDRVRMWIPEELAYKGKSHAPQGTLVFDVELVSISP